MSDIARAAGVSLATVERVLHHNGYVSTENRSRIETLIREMGYVPNQLASGLKKSRSMLIGHMVVFNPNMLFAKISLAVDKAAASQGFHVLTLTSHPGLNEEEDQVKELIGRRADGVIVTSNSHLPPALIERMVELNIPVVMVERTFPLPFVDLVQIDDLGGARMALNHLLQKGHRRIAFIGMQPFHEVEKLRYLGYCESLRQAGIAENADYVRLIPEYSITAGFDAVVSLMSQNPPPTAIFATSDMFVCGVLQYLYQAGLRVPQDVSIVGYDDTLSTLLAPPITSIGLNLNEIGRNAVDLLLQRMDDLKHPATVLPIKTVLIDRNSVSRLLPE